MVIELEDTIDERFAGRARVPWPERITNTVVYDLEIVRAISKKGEQRLPDVEYCSGFDDHANMGVSCLCAWDGGDPDSPYRVFTDPKEWHRFIVSACSRPTNPVFWGYNNVRFDNKVLLACGWDVPRLCGDLLAELWAHSGLDPDVYNHKSHGGYALDAIAKINGRGGKSGNGAKAPVWWQRGEYGKVIDYCLRDVALTTALVLDYLSVGIMSPAGRVVAVELEGGVHGQAEGTGSQEA